MKQFLRPGCKVWWCMGKGKETPTPTQSNFKKCQVGRQKSNWKNFNSHLNLHCLIWNLLFYFYFLIKNILAQNFHFFLFYSLNLLKNYFPSVPCWKQLQQVNLNPITHSLSQTAPSLIDILLKDILQVGGWVKPFHADYKFVDFCFFSHSQVTSTLASLFSHKPFHASS